MKKIKPNIYFIGIGGSRCMLNWIAQNLREHPELNVPYPNELHFFTPTKKGKSNYELEGIKGYYKRFKKNEKKAGEYSPQYLYDEKTPHIIKKHFPNIKILVALRNPIKRYAAEYTHLKFFEGIKFSKEELIDKSMYYRHLSRYFKIFPKKNIKVILLDDIDKDRKKAIQDIYKFLEVNHEFVPPSVYAKVNRAAKPKYKILHLYRKKVSDFVEFLKQHEMVFIVDLFRFTGLNKLSWYIWEKNRAPIKRPKLSDEEKKELMKKFLPDIKKLEKLINRNLSSWKKM